MALSAVFGGIIHLVFGQPVFDDGETAAGAFYFHVMYDAQRLYGQKRRKRDERDAAERVGVYAHAGGIHGQACADRHGQDEGADHRAGSDSARVERYARIHLGREKGHDQRYRIAGNEYPQHGYAGQHAHHRQSEGYADAYAEAVLHGPFGYRAGGNLSDLFGQDVNGGFGRDDEVSEYHRHGHEQRSVREIRQLHTELGAYGHEPYVSARKEYGKPHEGVSESGEHFEELVAGKRTGEQLREQKEREYGRESDQHVRRILAQSFGKSEKRAPGSIYHGDRRRGIRNIRCAYLKYYSDDFHGDYGADAGQRDKTEGVVSRVLAASYGGDADAETHYERHGHGTGGHAARVE